MIHRNVPWTTSLLSEQASGIGCAQTTSADPIIIGRCLHPRPDRDSCLGLAPPFVYSPSKGHANQCGRKCCSFEDGLVLFSLDAGVVGLPGYAKERKPCEGNPRCEEQVVSVRRHKSFRRISRHDTASSRYRSQIDS